MGPLTEGDLVLFREMIPVITQITLVKRSDPEFEGHLPMEGLSFRKPDDTWVIGDRYTSRSAMPMTRRRAYYFLRQLTPCRFHCLICCHFVGDEQMSTLASIRVSSNAVLYPLLDSSNIAHAPSISSRR
jgi:hypothetical protein